MEIYIANIKWKNGGYNRPALVLEINNDHYKIYTITSKYNILTYTNRMHYYKISKWKESGLVKQSYIDTSKILIVHKSLIFNKIGSLTTNDIKKLNIFINNKKKY